MSTTGLEVIQGPVRISSIDVLRDTKDVLVLEVDLHSKYPEVFMSGGFGDIAEIHLWPNDRTLHLDNEATTPLTTIRLPDHTLGWLVSWDAGKYTVRIVAARTGRRREIWRDDS